MRGRGRGRERERERGREREVERERERNRLKMTEGRGRRRGKGREMSSIPEQEALRTLIVCKMAGYKATGSASDQAPAVIVNSLGIDT